MEATIGIRKQNQLQSIVMNEQDLELDEEPGKSGMYACAFHWRSSKNNFRYVQVSLILKIKNLKIRRK